MICYDMTLRQTWSHEPTQPNGFRARNGERFRAEALGCRHSGFKGLGCWAEELRFNLRSRGLGLGVSGMEEHSKFRRKWPRVFTTYEGPATMESEAWQPKMHGFRAKGHHHIDSKQ